MRDKKGILKDKIKHEYNSIKLLEQRVHKAIAWFNTKGTNKTETSKEYKTYLQILKELTARELKLRALVKEYKLM